MTDRFLGGWRVRCSPDCGFAVKELAPWAGDDRAPDIEIGLGAVPDRLPDPMLAGPFLTIGRDGTCQLTIEGVARYRAIQGSKVTIEPLGEAEAPDITVFLLGTVFGILCYQRGLMPLHASVVNIGGRAAAFTGASGSGKSTLAAALVGRGHVLLADDVAVIDADAPDGPLIHPSFPRLKLWNDSLAALAIDPAALARTRPAQDKFNFPTTGFDPSPVPLAAIYGLATARGPRQPGIDRQTGQHALATLSSNLYRARIGHLLARKAALFPGQCRIARTVCIANLYRPEDLGELDTLASEVERHVLALPA